MLARPGLLLTAAAGLLTACAPRAWPLITGILLLLAALAIIMTPFERIVILLCILRRTDPCPYLRLPESARQNNAARAPRQARCQHGYYPEGQGEDAER